MPILTQPSSSPEVQFANELLGGWLRRPMQRQHVDQAVAAERHARLKEARQDAYAKRVAHDDVRALLDRLQIALDWDVTERITREAINGYHNGRLVAEFRDVGQE